MYGKPPASSLANRPSTRSAVASSSWGKSGMSTAGIAVPGTARVPTGFGRPGTRGLTGMQVAERPMTHQGLGGMKTGIQGPGRMILDRTFFAGELRQRLNAITNELGNIGSEMESIGKDVNNYASFEKKATILGDELKELQGKLGDYNTLLDKIHSDANLEDIERQYEELQIKTEQDSKMLNDIFLERQKADNEIRECERQIKEEQARIDKQINSLPPYERTEYYDLQNQNQNYILEISQQQVELEEVQKYQRSVEEEVEQDPLRRKAFQLALKEEELKAKKEELEEEERQKLKEQLPDEKERLLAQVKEDNQEISVMDRRMIELEEECKRHKQDISQLDIEMDAHQSDKNAKFEELVKRDQEMQKFIDTFEEKKLEAINKNKEGEKSVVGILENIGRLANQGNSLPSKEEYLQLKGDLEFKEREMEKSENTIEAILRERDNRLHELEKVKQLESKIELETTHSKDKLATLTEQLLAISNIDEIKAKYEAEKEKYLADRGVLKLQRDSLKARVQSLSNEYEGRKQQITENETNTHLGALEQRLRHHEMNNFHLREYISSKCSESNYIPVMNNVLTMTDECNQQIMTFMSFLTTK